MKPSGVLHFSQLQTMLKRVVLPMFSEAIVEEFFLEQYRGENCLVVLCTFLAMLQRLSKVTPWR